MSAGSATPHLTRLAIGGTVRDLRKLLPGARVFRLRWKIILPAEIIPSNRAKLLRSGASNPLSQPTDHRSGHRLTGSRLSAPWSEAKYPGKFSPAPWRGRSALRKFPCRVRLFLRDPKKFLPAPGVFPKRLGLFCPAPTLFCPCLWGFHAHLQLITQIAVKYLFMIRVARVKPTIPAKA